MLDVETAPAECESEQAFFDLWHAQPDSESGSGASPTQLAVRGGQLADRAAWVFVAGYQGALRQCFPALRDCVGWASYLVSEARDDSKSPTCTVAVADVAVTLAGTKNWVAASPHVQWLLVNATAVGGATNHLLLAADTPGVELIAKPSGRFLPELEVGRVRFNGVVLPQASLLEAHTHHAELFGLIEARCLLVALGAHFSRLAPAADEPAQSLLLSSGLVTAELGSRASVAVLLEAMDLLVGWFAGWHGGDPGNESAVASRIRKRWAADQRLLQMHRPLLIRQQQALL